MNFTEAYEQMKKGKVVRYQHNPSNLWIHMKIDEDGLLVVGWVTGRGVSHWSDSEIRSEYLDATDWEVVE